MLHKLIVALCAIALVGIVGLLLWQTQQDPLERRVDEADATTEASTSDATVVLTKEKLAHARVGVAVVKEGQIQPQRTIAGRLDYDQDRHIAIQSACAGILTGIFVRPGDQVTVGQTVAVVSCPEVGIARSEVLARMAELKLARTQQDWNSAICTGVEQLAEMIRSKKSPIEIESALKNSSLGEYREKLMSAYTRDSLASSVVENSRSAALQGAVAIAVQRQRESEQNTASAALASVLEQSLFEVKQQCSSASSTLAQAERMVEISLQRLNALLGPAASPNTVEQFANAETSLLSDVNLVSPIDGTVEERSLSVNERVAAGQSLFVLADCKQLWAVADIREGDWNAISVAIGEGIQISSPAIPDKIFDGRVFIVGRRFDPTTGAAPLIATIAASDPRLRPGLFIRMTIPTAVPRTAVVVPAASIVVHEGKHFVFIAESESTFRRVDVEVGESSDGETEILSGLRLGDRIAASELFMLKSELLLAGTEE